MNKKIFLLICLHDKKADRQVVYTDTILDSIWNHVLSINTNPDPGKYLYSIANTNVCRTAHGFATARDSGQHLYDFLN